MALTKSQLEALVDDIYKSNGVGAITGPVPNYLMKQIIAAIFDNLVGGDLVTPDGRSIKLNANKQLEVYLPEWLSMDPSSQAAPVINFNKSGAMHGLWVKVDGRTIFGNNGILTTSGGGGGTNPNVSIEAYDFQDDSFSTEVETRNAYLSESGSNGYLKIATGEAEDYGYINSKSVVTMDQNPVLTVKMKLESITDTVAKIYLSELSNGQTSGAGIMLIYDSSVDEYWHLVVTDGGENTVDLATLIAADTDEHLFDIRVKDGNIAWLIDDEVAGTEDSIDLGETELKCGVSVESLSADGTAMVIDTISKLSVRSEETGVEFSATPVHEKGGFELTFDDILNAPVADPSNVSEWNTLFDLPANGTAFTSVTIETNTVKLYGGSGIVIADYRFQNNVNILSIDDKAGCISAIGYKAFDHCTACISFKFIACTTVGAEAFYLCSNASIEMINLETAGSQSFYGMSSASAFNFPKLTEIPGQCFMNCSNAIGFNFPIAAYAAAQAFRGCSGSSTFLLPLCETIGNYCFYGCNHNALYDLSSVTSLGDSVASNNVFNSISGKTISLTVKTALMACNTGNPDGDIQTLQANNTVTITTV